MAAITTRDMEMVEKTSDITVDFCIEQAAKSLSSVNRMPDATAAEVWVKIAYAVKDCVTSAPTTPVV